MKLEEELNFLKHIVDAFPGHIYWKDKEGRYIGCNKQQAESLKLDKKDLIGKTDFELPWKELAAELTKIDRLVMKNEKTYEVEEIVNLPDREGFSVFLTRKSPLYNQNNEVVGIIGVSIDITERKKTLVRKEELEKALEGQTKANQEKEKTLQLYKQFVADQEHDIRTPLGHVASCSEFLLSELSASNLLSEELRFLLEGVSASSREILDYQESLLFELYQGQISEETLFTRFNLPEIVECAFNVNLASARYKKIDYECVYDDKIPSRLLGDGKRIYQCLVDLLSNAINFTEHGQVKLTVELLESTSKVAVIRFNVYDTGMGIPADKQADILKAFVKAKPSNKGGKRGRGLGLTRVSRYIEDMEGELRFVSHDGKGSCFKMVIPLAISLDQTEIE